MTFSLKPVFVGWITLLVQLPLQLFLTVWSGGFFGGISSPVFPKFTVHIDATTIEVTSFVFFGALAFFGVPLVAYFGKLLNYARTEYRFFDDHFELEEGFFSINRKVINYADVREITLHRGILQRMCGLGTIYLATLATGSAPRTNVFSAVGFGNISASGVGIRDIRDPLGEYERIRGIVNLHR